MCSRMQKCTRSSRIMPYSPFGDFVTFVVKPGEHFYLRRPEALQKDNMDHKCNKKMENNQASNNGQKSTKRNHPSVKPWTVKVDASGFDHKDFDISTEGHTMVIRAQHRENTETGYKMHEMKQVLQVPRDIVLHTLRTTLTDSGQLEIKGVRKTGGNKHMLLWSPFHLLKHMLDVADDEEASGDETVDLRNQEEMVTEATHTVQTGSETSSHQTSDKNSSEPNNGKRENVSQGNRQPSEDKSVDEEPAQNVTSSSDTEEGEEAKPQQEQIAPCEAEAEQKAESADRETIEKSTPLKESVESDIKEVEIEKSSPAKEETSSSTPWEVTLTLAGFDPDDLQLVVSGDVISVRGEHTHEEDGMHTQRHISRSFTLPSHVNPHTIRSTFNDKGKLTIDAKSSNMVDSSAKLMSIRYI